VFHVESWMAVIFNPSFPYRFTHMFVASLLTSAFVLMGISSWRFINRVDGPGTWKVFYTGLVMAMVLAPLQAFIGDQHGLNTLEHQPAKIAAMEAIWETEENVPFTLFAFPDETNRDNRFALEIPYAASLILTHSFAGEIRGLNEFEGNHPPVAPLFWCFRIMVGMGVVMIFVSWWTGWRVFVRKAAPSLLQLRIFSLMTFSGWIAVLAGWYVNEIGRQPWLIYGEMTVQEAVADHGGGMVLSTLVIWLLMYAFILYFYIVTLRHLARKPSASLVNNVQNYPGLLPPKEA
jgi:cytochrome d ubiquinol oxidase subunit I